MQSYIKESELFSCLSCQPSPDIFTTHARHVSYTTRNSFIAVNRQPHHHPISISANQPTLLNASNTNQPCRQAHRTAPTPRAKAPTHPVPPHPQPVRYPLSNLFTSSSCHDSNTQQPAHQACTQHRAALPAVKRTANHPSSTTAGARSTTRIRLLRRRMGGTTIKMASLLVKEDGRGGYNGVR